MMTLKPLPGVPAGTQLKEAGDVYQVPKPTEHGISLFHKTVVLNQPEWFGEIVVSAPKPAVKPAPKKVGRPATKKQKK